MTEPRRPVRIANCSGFFGDRLSAAREMVDGGPIDVLTGDWLAELTMLILAKQKIRNPEAGYAKTFLRMLEDVLPVCMERGIKVVSNAGGLAPAACAAAVREIATRLGVNTRVAHIEGDDLAGTIAALDPGVALNADDGQPLRLPGPPLTANAYLGGWGIARALERGADVVITGRVTDASLVVGPAAWWHGWATEDWDALAGAVAAGHVIECGTQATGGNFSGFLRLSGLEDPGFPIAEVAADGSSVITKHPGTGGAVTIGTVTAQLLYEIGAPAYDNPDVTTLFDTIELAQEGDDRVVVTGTKGSPPPPLAKVAIGLPGRWRNSATFVITGADVEAKAALAEAAVAARLPGGLKDFEESRVELLGRPADDPATNTEAVAFLRISVRDSDQQKAGRAFSSAAVETALGSYPGLTMLAPPADARMDGMYVPALIPRSLVKEVVVFDEERVDIEHPPTRSTDEPAPGFAGTEVNHAAASARRRARLGEILDARSGDKGGNANLGVWVPDARAFGWLSSYLTVDELKRLMPEVADLRVERHALPNLNALNFVIHRLLDDGGASTLRFDGQAKGLGEYLRAKHADIPAELLSDR